MDLSYLDKKYFLDGRRYNCPFCNRKSVVYNIISKSEFNWTEDKSVYIYLVQCLERNCGKTSMHLSYFNFPTGRSGNAFEYKPLNMKAEAEYKSEDLDDYFFFHQPTSFFTIDSRINKKLRELLSEAENCLKMNFLVGASACVRKAIYELIDLEKVRVIRDNGRTNYTDSIKKLKEKFQYVPGAYFDALSNIQELASDNVHEGSWEAWDSKKLKILIESTKNVLHEMYVVPQEQKTRVGVVTKLVSAFKPRESGKEIREEDTGGGGGGEEEESA